MSKKVIDVIFFQIHLVFFQLLFLTFLLIHYFHNMEQDKIFVLKLNFDFIIDLNMNILYLDPLLLQIL